MVFRYPDWFIKYLCLLALLLSVGQASVSGQSLEMMPGTERFFTDVQWLEFFDDDRKWSLFSRSRATSDYKENTSLFTGAYLNYTSMLGLGGTVVGRISSLGAGGDAGVHLFKADKKILIYALASLGLSRELSYSWFSIVRFTPPLVSDWDLYSSVELFSNFDQFGHTASVQRMRLGVGVHGCQFGMALNLSGIGMNYQNRDSNPGIFIRKQF